MCTGSNLTPQKRNPPGEISWNSAQHPEMQSMLGLGAETYAPSRKLIFASPSLLVGTCGYAFVILLN